MLDRPRIRTESNSPRNHISLSQKKKQQIHNGSNSERPNP